MTRIIRTLSLLLLAAAVAGLITSCNLATSPSPDGATGRLNLLVTDAPTDDWQEVTVVLKSVGLFHRESQSWQTVWTADPANPAAGKINLVDLSGVALILEQATLPVGTYGRARLAIDTDPATMKLVDDMGNVIDPAQIKVVDPSGRGEIRIDLDPAVAVVEGETANLQVDFDLAHPLSIVVLDGQVFINLQVRHKLMPRRLAHLQFARNIGDITAAAADATSFSIKTLHGAELTFAVNDGTIYVDADSNQPGSFAGLAALAGSGSALVASNMNADGSLYARRVWYAASVDTLPRFTPEGLVRRVGENWLQIIKKRTVTTAASVRDCDWTSDVVFVDGNTAWTFRQEVHMGVGLDVLQHIRRGFRVEVTLVDPTASVKTAAAINVLSAHVEGVVTDATAEAVTFGWWDFRGWAFAYSGVADHAFSWWFFGLPSSASPSVADFVETIDQTKAARLWAFAWAGLYWDEAGNRWVVENLVLAPEKLRDPTRITTGYSAPTGSMGVTTSCWWDEALAQTLTVHLDTTGDLQTVVASVLYNSATRVQTVVVPVPPADWPALLTPELPRVRIWVRPVKGTDGMFTWRAYTVIAYRVIG